jgi:hypothetical protein
MAGKPKDTVERYGAQWPLIAMHDIDYDELADGPIIPGNAFVNLSVMEILSAADGTSTTLDVKLVDPDGVESDINLSGTPLDAKTVDGVSLQAESAKTKVPMRLTGVVSETVTQGKFRIGVGYFVVGRTNEVNE